jgi:hypothetical protein
MPTQYLDSTLGAAFDLADRGWAVFPVDSPELDHCAGIGRGHDPASCTDRGKHPLVAWGTEASTDPKQIAAWFAGSPPRNIGIACGPSGVVVLDEDTPGDLARYTATVGATVPETYTVATGRGSHFYFRAPEGVAFGNSEGALKNYGVNVRGAGGYVVGPGSLHASGALYTVVEDVAPAPMPAWLLDALRPAQTTAEAPPSLGGLLGVPDVIRGPRPDAPGVRHNVLTSYAGSMRARDIPADEARVLMASVWRRCEQPPACTTPYTWDEAAALLADVYNRYPPNAVAPPVTVFEPTDDSDDPEEPPPRTFTPGGTFILDTRADPAPIWGSGSDVLLADGESLVIAGGQGLGKTTLAQQIALGRCGFPEYAELLGFPIIPGARKTLYLAMDRPRQAARSFRRMVGSAWRAELDAKLVVWQGPPPADLAKYPGQLLDLCRRADADTIIVDSLKDAAIGLNDDEVGAGYNRARQHVTTAGVQIIELHHLRKAQGTVKVAPGLDDLYGSTWLSAGAGSVLVLTGAAGDAIVNLRHVKQPADEVGPLRVFHNYETGRSTVFHAVDLLDLAKRPLSAVDAARALFDVITPDANQKKKAQRKLDQLVKAGHLRVCQVGNQGTKAPTLWVCK